MKKALIFGAGLLLFCFSQNDANAGAELTPGELSPIVVFMNFEGDASFPSITWQHPTDGLARFTGSALNVPGGRRQELINKIVEHVRADYASVGNVTFVTDTTGIDTFYTWGIDDRSYVFSDGPNFPSGFDPLGPCPEASCSRLYGKAATYPNPSEKDILGRNIFHPMTARTFAGSFGLPAGSASPSDPPLIFGEPLNASRDVGIDEIAQALGNNAAHEIAHLFGVGHSGGRLNLMDSDDEGEEARTNKLFSNVDRTTLNHNLVTAATADAFEPNESMVAPVAIGPGNHDLTLHSVNDFDNFELAVTEDGGDVQINVSYNFARNNQAARGLLEIDVQWRDDSCANCPWISIPPTATDAGWRVEQGMVPAGRRFRIFISQTYAQRPITYTMNIATGVNLVDLPPDRHEPNDTEATAANWIDGCNFTGSINLHTNGDATTPADVDYYKIDASGSSVEAIVLINSFTTTLALDGVEATEITDLGDRGQRRIVGCGQQPSIVKVAGSRDSYDLCIRRIPLEPQCEGFVAWTPFTGRGSFDFTIRPFGSPTLNDVHGDILPRMFARIESETDTTVQWRIAAVIEYPTGARQRARGFLDIPKPPNDMDPPVFTGSVLPAQGLAEWFQVDGTSVGQGTFGGTFDNVTTFDVSSVDMLRRADRPDELGTLLMQGAKDSDGDLLSDATEIAFGTDPLDDDTDDDGILDGQEDSNGNGIVDSNENIDLGSGACADCENADIRPAETDPRVFDSDGDGLSDGTETGVVVPRGVGTDPAKFVPDLDPLVTTDPNNPDSDHDGKSDGEEDADRNGRLDSGETSPVVANVFVSDPGDVDSDGDVDRDDLNLLLAARNSPASGTDDPMDLDDDGVITTLDARILVTLCTRPRCATQ